MMIYITRSPALPLRLRKKLARLARLPAIGTEFTVPFFGSIYHGRIGNHIDNKIYLYGAHEAATLRLIQVILQAAPPPKTFVDIGVNSGAHLICGARVADQSYGFEPWPAIRPIADRNIDANTLSSKVTLLPYGLSDCDEILPYLAPAGTNLGTGAFAKDNVAQVEQETGVSINQAISLQVRRGDDVMRELNIRPTLIKIDTEGFEKHVLTGLKDTLAQHRPAVIFELGTVNRHDFATPAMTAGYFPNSYQFYGILRSREYPRLVPFDPHRRYENVLAWPITRGNIQSLCARAQP